MFKSKEQENYFEEILNDSINASTHSSKYLRRAHYSISITNLFLSSILTIILGLHLGDDNYVIQSKNIALVIGATITFLTGVNIFWKLESYWIRRKITVRRLEDLKAEYHFEKLSEKEYDITNLFLKYQSIQNYSTIYWEDVYNESKTEKKSEKI